MWAMTILIVLSLLWLLTALVLFMMVRQVGVLMGRLPESQQDIQAEGPLTSGQTCPVNQIVLRGQKVAIPLNQQETILLFASFSCANCRQILERLRELDPTISARLIFMCLDDGIQTMFASEIRRLGLESIQMAEARTLAGDFKIHHTPYVYIIDGQGEIIQSALIHSGYSQFQKLIKSLH